MKKMPLFTEMLISSNESQYIHWLLERLGFDFDLAKTPEYWACMSEAISHTNWTHPYRKEMEVLFRMTPKEIIHQGLHRQEQRLLKMLPDIITVYRGSDKNAFAKKKALDHTKAISWSMSKGVAARFARFNLANMLNKDPVIITAEVKKEDIAMVILGRHEREIITFKPKVISTEKALTGVSWKEYKEHYGIRQR